MHQTEITLTRFGDGSNRTAPSLVLPLDEGDDADAEFIISTGATDSHGD